MAKFKQTFDEMVAKNRELFIRFKIVHDQYASNPRKYKQEFNDLGEKVLPILHEYENILCGKSENSGYSRFSSNLADKFWSEIRKNYPKIDFVGIKAS